MKHGQDQVDAIKAQLRAEAAEILTREVGLSQQSAEALVDKVASLGMMMGVETMLNGMDGARSRKEADDA